MTAPDTMSEWERLAQFQFIFDDGPHELRFLLATAVRALNPEMTTDGAMGAAYGMIGDLLEGWHTRAQPVAEWRPISEAPKDGTCILACRPFTIPDVLQWNHPPKLPEGKWVRRAGGWGKSGTPHFEPTHFMPLPEPPHD